MTSAATESQNTRRGGRGVATTSAKRRDAEVLAAAARVFHRRGYAEASVQDVADELGILKGSLYHYIKTKEDLLFRLLEETHDEIHSLFDEVAALEGLNPLERLAYYLRRQVEYNIDNLIRVSVYYHDINSLGSERRKRITERRREHETFVADLISDAQQQGLADPGPDAVVLARCVFANVIWVYRWVRPGRHDREQIADVCVRYAINGVIGGNEPYSGPALVADGDAAQTDKGKAQ